MIVPTLRVGMQPVTLCVTTVLGIASVVRQERGIPTQSVGTISLVGVRLP